MSSKPIPPLGLTAFRLLAAQHDAELIALNARYQTDCETLGDEILAALGEDPTNPSLTVCLGDGIVTGFVDPDVQAILSHVVAQLQAERPEDATPVVTPEQLEAAGLAPPTDTVVSA